VKHYGLKLFFAAAFALTLAFKLLVNQRVPAPADPELFEKAVASFLHQHGFASRLETRSRRLFIYAKAEKCRMLIREAEPHGWNNSATEFHTKEVGRLRYVFDGTVYEHEPFLAPVIGQYWTILRIKMGLSPNSHPVLAVAASDDCAIDTLPWWELSILS
jgi:hypothetical protein